jgi:hypothetical protein
VKTFSIICLGLALVFLPAGRGFADAPAKTPRVIVPPHSTFIQPASPAEGRDPFYPESMRVFESAPATTQHVEAITTIAVKGVSVVNGRPVVILNNHSFMAGDEGDVISGNSHVHVHCLEIRPGTVVVEINGARHEIRY